MRAPRPLVLLLLLLALSGGPVGCASSLPASGPAPLRYTALGASDALGIGAFPPTSNGYVFRIRDAVQQQTGRPVALTDIGIPAAEIAAIEEAMQASLRVGPKPDLVTLWTGPNDVTHGADPAAFEAVLRRMLSTLRDKTTAVVVLANVPDLTRLPFFVEHPSAAVTTARILAFNTAIERQALAFNVPVVHLYEQPFMEDYVSDLDGFHPSNEGHAAIAELFLRVILPRFSPAGEVRIGRPPVLGLTPPPMAAFAS